MLKSFINFLSQKTDIHIYDIRCNIIVNIPYIRLNLFSRNHDILVTDKINKKTTIKPMSENAVAPAGNKDRVWDFSADLYCRNEADWEVYLIENP